MGNVKSTPITRARGTPSPLFGELARVGTDIEDGNLSAAAERKRLGDDASPAAVLAAGHERVHQVAARRDSAGHRRHVAWLVRADGNSALTPPTLASDNSGGPGRLLLGAASSAIMP